MSNLLSRIKKIEAVLGEKNEWREKPNFLDNVLNRNFGNIFRKEDLQFFSSSLEAVICGIEVHSICVDIKSDGVEVRKCENCTDETCNEVRKRIKERNEKLYEPTGKIW